MPTWLIILTNTKRIIMTGMKDKTVKKPFNTPSTNKPLTHCTVGEALTYVC
jgi:hypothetical protein